MATDPIERLFRAADIPIEPRTEFSEALLSQLLDHLEGDQPTNDGKETTMAKVIAMPPLAGTPGFSPTLRPWARPSFTLANFATAALLLLTLAGGLFAFGAPRNWGMFDESSPGVENELIARADVETLSDSFLNTFTGISRFTLEPGATLTSGPDSEYGDGVYLFEVESGSVTLTADGRAEMMTEESDQATPLASGTDVVLAAGDRGVLWPEVTATWRTDGPGPAVVLIAAAGEAVDSVVAVDEVNLVKSFSTGWPELPATFAFHRLTFEPDASLPVVELPGLMMLAVETGSLGVPLANADGTPSRVREFRPGDGMIASDWTIAGDGELHNPGSEPVVVYALLAVSAETAATPES